MPIGDERPSGSVRYVYPGQPVSLTREDIPEGESLDIIAVCPPTEHIPGQVGIGVVGYIVNPHTALGRDLVQKLTEGELGEDTVRFLDDRLGHDDG